MAVRAGGKIGGVRYAGSSHYEPIVTLPTILSSSSATPASGSALVLTGVNFSASGNAVYLTDGNSAAAQPITAENATSITITVDRAQFRYGPLSLYVVDAAEDQGPDYPIQLTPPTGWAYVNLTVDDRIRSIGSLSPGDQLAYESPGGLVHLRVVGSFWIDAAAVPPLAFDVEAWTPGTGWGLIGTQQVEIPGP